MWAAGSGIPTFISSCIATKTSCRFLQGLPLPSSSLQASRLYHFLLVRCAQVCTLTAWQCSPCRPHAHGLHLWHGPTFIRKPEDRLLHAFVLSLVFLQTINLSYASPSPHKSALAAQPQDQQRFKDEVHIACCEWREYHRRRDNAVLESLIEDEQEQLRIQAERPDASAAEESQEWLSFLF